MTFNRIAVALLMTGLATQAIAQDLSREQLQFFETKIRPVLVRECYGCHSNKAGNVRGGLRLDTRELTHIGGRTGPAVVPGNLEESWLYNAITHQDFVMPPKRKLPQSVINDFRKWIEMGAPDPRQTDVAEIRSSISKEDVERARESFWAYKKPTRPQSPAVDDAAWPRTDIDRFILAKLEQAELQPASDAEAYKVLRRLCFDLIGLPPTPEQVNYFTKQWKTDPDHAIEFVVDRLLKKKQFGERWGRHWLDVVRYAESTGREYNYTYPHAWRYRDYVIDSFNADKPFDRFVQEQIAGDLLPVKTDEQWAENLIATTFLAIGPKNVNERNRVQFEADLIDEQIDATTRVFLGQSVACARCHDHKFDAIPQTDYYALAGVFRNATTYFGNPPSEFGQFSGLQAQRSSSLIILPIDDPNPYDKRYSSKELNDLKEQAEEKVQVLNSLPRTGVMGSNEGRDILRQRIRLTDEMSRLSAKLSIVDEDGTPRSYTMGVQEQGSPVNARLLERGEIDQPGRTVKRGFPKVLCSTPVKIKEHSSGRLELARFIGSDDNSLTARVMVNRIWQHMIGHGIVRSTEDFGVTGQFPSHPELLDYLAVRFVESGWSVKSLVKDIAMSRVYRMSSAFNQEYHEYDSDNALVWRANPRRLDAEAIRDAMLSVSGELNDERPRGSEVAKAGYTRVQGGSLVSARVMAQNANEQARGGGRMRFNGQAGGRPQFGAGNRPGQGRFQGKPSLADQSRVNQLDMEDAKFRSVYLPVVRDEEPRSLAVFDFADSNAIVGTRESSHTADQSLYMLNNRFVIGQSAALAQRITNESSNTREQIERAFVLTYGRPPTSGERSAAETFVHDFGGTTSTASRKQATLQALCQSLFASAEFRFID
ncbi:protein containing planctomycete cytochrome C domain protein [Rhodopirellula baltica SH28]|uniref:Protein containing planctomycete cytochrome C domain protein n=1 Tax=Rhodopirellula baltica SH28 TaxID=993517 RepID=K5CDK0_RHOBT|nr:PSD1 and planctomycete cytochrome C domain-containing protein [Rhodopirellula baltica]EKK01735.1 protein containing planctomycete cytochrome C domain protein [Rhodopirellula baltica SH28]